MGGDSPVETVDENIRVVVKEDQLEDTATPPDDNISCEAEARPTNDINENKSECGHIYVYVCTLKALL